jgi:hypothetical protein
LKVGVEPRMTLSRVALCALLLVSVVGCGPEVGDQAVGDTPTEARTRASAPANPAAAGLDARVYADEGTLPAAEAYEHVGVATDPEGLQQQWQRFGFADVPPVIDMGERDVLFLGFGESGSCPVIFGGLTLEEATLRVEDDQPAQGCTADYNPRTLAVSVAKGSLPEGYLTVDMPADAADVTIAAHRIEEPPPATSHAISSSVTDVVLLTEPGRAPLGSTVDVLIRNDTDTDRVATGQVVTIDRWTGHHFETLGQVSGDQDVVEVGPGETGVLLQLDTNAPAFPTGEPGWFRLTAHLDVTTGTFGRLDARGNLHLTEQRAQAPSSTMTITAPPPCDDHATCAAGVLIDGVRYERSCGLVDPETVSGPVYAAGEGITAHLLDGVDPRVMLAWEGYCEPPMDGRWHLLLAPDHLGTPEHETAWCRVSLHPPDPAEGFSC